MGMGRDRTCGLKGFFLNPWAPWDVFLGAFSTGSGCVGILRLLLASGLPVLWCVRRCGCGEGRRELSRARVSLQELRGL